MRYEQDDKDKNMRDARKIMTKGTRGENKTRNIREEEDE
jgi:hypothetical protein